MRPVESAALEAGLSAGTRTVSVFLVNRRKPARDEVKDKAFAFQAQLEIHADMPFIARPDLRGLASEDWDDRIADLQYRDTGEYAVGHNVATEAILTDGHARPSAPAGCRRQKWNESPPPRSNRAELKMDVLAALADFARGEGEARSLVTEYRAWISKQTAPDLSAKRKETTESLQSQSPSGGGPHRPGHRAARRSAMSGGIQARQHVMALAATAPLGRHAGQAARIGHAGMAALPVGIPADESARHRPTHRRRSRGRGPAVLPHRRRQDRSLPGAGRVHALVLRRMQNPGICGAGVSVLMRYTLRLLTLDQLGRAATLICALELERQKDVDAFWATGRSRSASGWDGRRRRTAWAAKATTTANRRGREPSRS